MHPKKVHELCNEVFGVAFDSVLNLIRFLVSEALNEDLGELVLAQTL